MIFICPLGDFCCTLMTTKDIIHLQSPQFLTTHHCEKFRPVTGYRCIIALHVSCFPPISPPPREPSLRSTTCHAAKDEFCPPHPRARKRLGHHGTAWGVGGDLQHSSGFPSGLNHRNQHGHGIPDHQQILHHHLGMMDVKYCWRIS